MDKKTFLQKGLVQKLALLLTGVLLAAGLAGCSGDPDRIFTEKVTSKGKVLNIYCWNDEFPSRVAEHYPGYTSVDDTTGTIGKVTVKWHITPNEDNAYQNSLDEALARQGTVKKNERIDIFLIEADYAMKYIDSPYALPVEKLGITKEDVAEQYPYTQDVATDSQGVLKGLSWQGCPGAMFYNRRAAKEVLGTDDPQKVQEYVKDWESFNRTAGLLKEAGYRITSTVNDTYRVYSNNVTSRWVEDGRIHIDDNLLKWVEDSKALAQAGETGTHDLWSDEWSEGFFPEAKVFAYFGPAWLINFSMSAETEGSIGYRGGWGAAQGPQSFFWGGTWICAAAGTDNGDLVKDIMLQLTANREIMTDIVLDDDDFVNNRPAMEEMAASDYTSAILGGQNPLPIYCAGVENLKLEYLSPYDQGCNEEFQHAMRHYFEGDASFDEALDLFYEAVLAKYPELSR